MLNELERQNIWQQVKHVELCILYSRLKVRENLIALDSQDGGGLICVSVVPYCRCK